MIRPLLISLPLLALAVCSGKASAQASLLTWWKLDEASGTTAADSSGNSTDGALAGNPVWQSSGGHIDGALEFDGSGDQIEDADAESYINGLAAFSVTLWVESDLTNVDKGLFFTQTPSDTDNRLGMRYDKVGFDGGGSQVIKFAIETTSGSKNYESSAMVQTTSWQFLALTWSSGETPKLYIDGTLDVLSSDSGSLGGSLTNTTTLLVGIGAKSDNWDGRIDDFRFYDGALSAAEITSLYAGASPTANGSRICDDNRVALAAIDADYTLAAASDKIIYAAGINEDGCDLKNGEGGHTLQYREVSAGSFADVPTSSGTDPFLASSGTDLANNTTVSSGERRANSTGSGNWVVAGREFTTSTNLDYANEVNGGHTEAQWALDFSACPASTTYEFRVVWGSLICGDINITYLAEITTPPPPPAAYTVMHETWTGTASGAWEVKDLSGAPYNVPAEAIVEIAVANLLATNEQWGGVRAYGSVLERRLQLHEAEGGGTDVFVTHVQTDASSRIEQYAQTNTNIEYTLLGYWDRGRYVEHFIELDMDASNTWQDQDLATSGVGPGDVAEIVLRHNKTGQERQFGVRTNGSGLSRLLLAHETEGGGMEIATMHVVADATPGATVEVYASNTTQVRPVLFGHWATPPGTYTELFTDIGRPTDPATWESKDLSSFGVPADAVTEIILSNTQWDLRTNMGVRDNGGSAARLLDLQEAENNLLVPSGGDFGRMHTIADASSIVELYDEDVTKSHQFLLTGYWVTESAVALAEHDAGQQPDAFTETASAMGAELFGFKLDPFGNTANVSGIVFSISTIAGLTDFDWTSVTIAVDDNGDGTIGAGETTTVGGAGTVDQAAGTIVFSGAFSVSTATNYILTAGFLALDTGDMVTVTLDDANITSSITVKGAATGVMHREGCFYFERQARWHTLTSGTWEIKDLSGYPYYVPANAVVEIAIQNLKGNTEYFGGVRAVGSALNRYFTLHEAEAGGMDVVVMQVQADGSSRIEQVGQDTTFVVLNLLGYWDCGTYVEVFQSFGAAAPDTWEAENLSAYGVGSGNVADVVLYNTDVLNAYDAGTRAVGTSHERRITLHPAEAGGVEVASMSVQADSSANAVIEIYADDVTAVQFYLLGYWSTAPMPYKQMFVSIGNPTASATWEAIDLASFAGKSGLVAEVLLANTKNNREDNIGVRANGSTLHRVVKLQEAEPSGGDFGRALVVIDDTTTIEFYHNNIGNSHDFIVTGYWGAKNTRVVSWQEIAPN